MALCGTQGRAVAWGLRRMSYGVTHLCALCCPLVSETAVTLEQVLLGHGGIGVSEAAAASP